MFFQKKRFLAPKPINSRQIFATVNSNRPFTNISNLESRDTSTHGGETELTNLSQRFAIREPPFWKTRELYLRILFCAQRSLFARHSGKLAISICAPFFECSVFYSRDILKSSRSLFARLPLCAALSICEPFWKVYDLYSRAFLWALRLVFFGCVQ